MPASSHRTRNGSVDVLILTAADDEDSAVRAVGDDPKLWRLEHKRPLEVWRADLPTPRGRPLRLALSKSVHMGTDTTGASAGILTEKLRPKCLAMCGVCAGRPGWVDLGDVIVAERVYRYDVGEWHNPTAGGTSQFSADILTHPLRAQWKQAAERLSIATDARWLAQRPLARAIQGEWVLRELHAGRNPTDPANSAKRRRRCPDWKEVVASLVKDSLIKLDSAGAPRLSAAGTRQAKTLLFEHPDGIPEPGPFKLHVGPMGTGSRLVRDVDIWAKLASDQRLLRGFDMEASVVGLAAYLNEIPWIVVKGVMDFAEPGRSQGFRKFAARAAAEVLIAFLRENADSVGKAKPAGDGRSTKERAGRGNITASKGAVAAGRISNSVVITGGKVKLKLGK